VDRGAKGRQFFVHRARNASAGWWKADFSAARKRWGKLANADYREQLAAAITGGFYITATHEKEAHTTVAVTRRSHVLK